MLLIPHFIAPSPIHGLGCFASVKVKKGEKIWEFNPIADLLISESAVRASINDATRMLLTHTRCFNDREHLYEDRSLRTPRFLAPSQARFLGRLLSVRIRKVGNTSDFNPITDIAFKLRSSSSTIEIIDTIETHAEYIPAKRIFRLGIDDDYFINHSYESNLQDFGD